MRLARAVKHIDRGALAREPEVAWNQIARMRDLLVHHYTTPISRRASRDYGASSGSSVAVIALQSLAKGYLHSLAQSLKRFSFMDSY